MLEPLSFLVLFLHLASAVVLVGGLFYAWNLSRSGILRFSPPGGFQPSILVAIALLLVTGLYQLMARMAEGGVPKLFHMLFGIKFLLFLHIAAVSIILVKPQTSPEKRARLLTGLVFSGFGAVLIGTALHLLH